MIPISFLDASTPRKPAKTAPPEQLELYKEHMKQRNLNTLAVQGLGQLQEERAAENAGTAPHLRVVVDGSYTNKNMLRHLPENTTLIGRIRKDARLSAKPDTRPPADAERIYGDDLPTPEQIRQDPNIPWITVRARASGQMARLRSQDPLTGSLARGRGHGSPSGGDPSRRLSACAKAREDSTPSPPI